MKSYLSLIKFSHTVFALPFALLGFFLATLETGKGFSWQLLVLVVLCMVFARSAAMAFNRYLDRDIDGKNPRTATREIPAGVISARAALFFVIVNSLLFIATTWFINFLCFALSPIALLIILGYSYTKRFTYLCHFVLGLGLALAPVGAYLAVSGRFDLIPVLYAAAVLLYLLLAVCVAIIEQKQASWVLLGLGLVCVGGVLHNVRAWRTSGQADMVVYQVPKETAVDVFVGRRMFALSTSDEESNKVARAAANYRLYKGVRHQRAVAFEDFIDTTGFVHRYGYFQWAGARVAMLHAHSPMPADSLSMDVVVLTGQAEPDMHEVKRLLQPKLIVFDGSSHSGRASRLKTSCGQLGIPYHDTRDDGAFVWPPRE